MKHKNMNDRKDSIPDEDDDDKIVYDEEKEIELCNTTWSGY